MAITVYLLHVTINLGLSVELQDADWPAFVLLEVGYIRTIPDAIFEPDKYLERRY